MLQNYVILRNPSKEKNIFTYFVQPTIFKYILQ